MVDDVYPNGEEIRAALLKRADEFTMLTGIPKSVIGKEAVNDGAFLSQVEDGRNFTIGMYERVMAWLDKEQKKFSEREVA